MKFDLSNWPEIDVRQASSSFREVPLEAYPELAGYRRADIHADLAGQGGLFLAADMARLLSLRPGMHVLDLGCGAGATSVFLAKTYGVRVFAVDVEIRTLLERRVTESGVRDLITIVRADARQLPFASGFFDAVFSMNAFFYFGTDDFYPPYLLRFLRNKGEVVIGSPCYRDEIADDTPHEFLLEFPDCLAVHSPNWWRRHFSKGKNTVVLHSSLHARGCEFWEDRVRFVLEQEHPREMPPWKRDMIHNIIRMLNRDTDGFVSHFMLHAKKTPNKAPEPTPGAVTPRATSSTSK